jgi:hypothetical protein
MIMALVFLMVQIPYKAVAGALTIAWFNVHAPGWKRALRFLPDAMR